VVAGVLGLDPQRGDQLVIESLPFEQTLSGGGELEEPEAGPKPTPNPLHLPLNLKTILIGAGALVVVVMVAMLLLRKKKRRGVTVSHMPVLPQAASAVASPPGLAAAGTAESAVSASASATVASAAEPPVFRLQLPPQGQKIEALRMGMKEIVQRDPAIAAGVLRGWIEEGEQ
jgi:flagellar M-ring protein FliF